MPAVVLLLLSSVAPAEPALRAAAAASFHEAYSLLSLSNLKLELASPDGRAAGFYLEEAASREHRAALGGVQTLERAAALEESLGGLVVPCSAGALADLATSASVARLVAGLLRRGRPVCAVGFGVAALLAAAPGLDWPLAGWQLTGATLGETARQAWFGRAAGAGAAAGAGGALVVEDRARELGGAFGAGEPDALHVVVDRVLVTAQNAASTALAVYAFVWLASRL
jgi:hypothetical protein